MKKISKFLGASAFAIAMGIVMFSNSSVSESMSNLNVLKTSVAEAEYSNDCIYYRNQSATCYCYGYYVLNWRHYAA